jgi:hypothetical protein
MVNPAHRIAVAGCQHGWEQYIGTGETASMHDTRLLGRWRSDATRTARDLTARRDIPAQQKAALRRLFGKMELRYTRKRCYSTLDGHTQSVPYQVVAKDPSSVAIVSYDLLLEQPTISHLHFDGSHMWVPVGTGLFREFFKRVPEPERQRRRAKRRLSSRTQDGPALMQTV